MRTILVALLCLVANVAWGYTFHTIDVPFPSASDTTCTGIDADGNTSGLYLQDEQTDVGFYHPAGGGYRMLPFVIPHGLTKAGAYVAWNTLFPASYLITKNEITQIFGPLDQWGEPPPQTEANGLNGNLVVAGDYKTHDGIYHAMLWQDGHAINLDPPSAWWSGWAAATAVNNNMAVVGTADNYGWVYRSGSFTKLSINADGWTIPQGINNHGLIVGTFVYPHGEVVGFVTPDGWHWNLIRFPGATQTEIFGVNDHGDLCGSYLDVAGVRHGFWAAY